MNTAERIELLAKQRKTTVTSVESALRLGHGVIRSWATSYPVASKILAVANYFDVSVDYLLCRTDDPCGFVAKPDESIMQLQRAMSKMTDVDKERAMGILKAGFAYAFDDDKTDEK